MKTPIKILLLLLLPALCLAQQNQVDSLKKALQAARTDSARFLTLFHIVDYYSEGNRDSALYYLNDALTISKKNRQMIAESNCLDGKGYIFMHMGKFPESLASFQQALRLAENPASEYKAWLDDKKRKPHRQRLLLIGSITHDIGHLMGATGNIDQQIAQYRLTEKLAIEDGDNDLLGLANMNLGRAYAKLNRLDSSLILSQNAERLMNQSGYKKYIGIVYDEIGQVYLKKGNKQLALQNYHKGLIAGIEQKNLADILGCYTDLADYYLAEKQKDSSLFYSRKALEVSRSIGPRFLGQNYENMYKSYALAGKTDSAYKYQGLALAALDSTYKATTKNLADFQKLSFQSQLRAQELEKEKEAIKTRIRTYVLLAAIVVFMLIAGISYRNNRQKQKANHLLSEQKEEIAAQRDNLEQALGELKTTQTQLIQSEKMASLGELTAGIAHEIQNPLNFVNNFSEVSVELIEEMETELKLGQTEDAMEIAEDVKQNLEKIRHHGKRADAIVKGMLQHSRTSSGQMEPTDLNALADEYLRLAYHGLRAKDKSFNAELVTHFDEKLPKIDVVPQDIGRVILNLLNNAFYATQQKAKTAGPGYKPAVEISTRADKSHVIITVKDNGSGIPESVREKIMQPFFTTKPTGEGTGLGLSLSYDIVVKGHGGKINIMSKESEGSEFIIDLPIA